MLSWIRLVSATLRSLGIPHDSGGMVGATVLVVDDDPLVRKLLAALLQGRGHSVLLAANGAEALDLLEDDPPDLILLDLEMPVLDGWGFVRAYRARRGTIPIVVVSAATHSAAGLQVQDRLTKPVGAAELCAVVARWSRLHADERAVRAESEG